MKKEFQKNLRILNGLLSYAHLKGATQYDVRILEQEDKVTVFQVKAQPIDICETDLQMLETDLNAPRSKEMEQAYWGLVGDNKNSSTLALVGMMTEAAEITYTGDTLSITLKRCR